MSCANADVQKRSLPYKPSDWLRTQTRTAHERAEAAVLRRLNVTSRASYVKYLERLFGLYQPLEAHWLHSEAYTRLVPECEQRHKTPWLLADLEHFGSLPQHLPLCRALPTPSNPLQVLGVSYVFEGATLGGSVLLSALRIEPAPSPGQGATFLSGYGANTARLWRSFKLALDQNASSEWDLEELKAGANAAFSAFEQWIETP